MSERDEHIRRIVAELEDQIARAEASVAVLKELLTEEDGAGPGGETSVDPG